MKWFSEELLAANKIEEYMIAKRSPPRSLQMYLNLGGKMITTLDAARSTENRVR